MLSCDLPSSVIRLLKSTPSLLLMCFLFIASSCPAAPPSDWPQASSARVLVGGCPEIAGTYTLRGESYFSQISSGKQETKRKSSTGSWIPFWHPRAKDGGNKTRMPVENGVSPKSGQFSIVQTASDRFEVRTLGRGGFDMEVSTFDRNLDDFSCVDGTVILKPTHGGGYSDGVGLDMRIEMRINRGYDGAVLYHQRIDTKSRSLFVLTKESVTDYYYAFAKTE